MHDDIFEHDHLSPAGLDEIARAIRAEEAVELITVGIDIGSSTSHLLFARLVMERRGLGLSSAFRVVSRAIVWRSPILLTPFLHDGTIDAAALGRFIDACYDDAGFARHDIDSGAVILTGEAIKRSNARAIDELFAADAGKFVCATAGHKLECILAAHGSGAVRLSKERDEAILHVDIGGGTTKLALIDRGRILGVTAFAVGGRLIAQDAAGAWTRIDDSAHRVAEDLGFRAEPAAFADPERRRQMAARLAAIELDYILDRPRDRLGAALALTGPLPRTVAPSAVSISGGVSEFLFDRADAEHGDLGAMLADALRTAFHDSLGVPVIDPGAGIRATVIGASQFTVQVSGKTIYLPQPDLLPVHNLPVVRLRLTKETEADEDSVAAAARDALARLDLDPAARMAVAFGWHGHAEHARLIAAARGLMRAVAPDGRRTEPLALVLDRDLGKSFGHLLHEELGLDGPLVCIDGVHLHELDFIDVGALLTPPGVVPVVVKSLLFS